MKLRSQAYQDLFALSLIGENGTYIEIGGHKPVKNSNTYNLEVFKNWKGFSIEFDTGLKKYWNKCPERKNKVYWEDALTFDYLTAVEENNLSKHINYLSCDIEPPNNTFTALKRVIEQGITFDCITFEHDLYQSKKDFNVIATDFLLSCGYEVAVTQVYYKHSINHFETWFIRKDLYTNTLTFDEWKKINNLL